MAGRNKNSEKARLQARKRNIAQNADNLYCEPKKQKFLNSVTLNGCSGSDLRNESDSGCENSISHNDIEERLKTDLTVACRVHNEDTDFTRFISSNDVYRVLPPAVWESLEREDYDTLFNRFGDEFDEDRLSHPPQNPLLSNGISITQGQSGALAMKEIQSDRDGGLGNSRLTKNTTSACDLAKDLINRSEKAETTSNGFEYTKNATESKRLSINQQVRYDRDLSVPLIPNKFYVALDCEMVGVGINGKCSALARCSIVDYDGQVIYDRYIKPSEPITDYRTRWSGISPRHMHYADPEDKALHDIYKCIENRIVIGHAVFNDFGVLRRYPPCYMVRDTARCKLLVEMAGLEGQGNSLKKLAFCLLNKTIQTRRNGHDSVEDATATLELFKIVRFKWEPELFAKWMKKGIDIKQTISVMEEHESKRHDDVDYLSDKYWPSHLLA